MKHNALPSRMRGLSLVEVMVSLVIGLVVVGAVLVSYIASGKTSAQQAAYAEMNENAQLGLSLLSQDLLLAGYGSPTGFELVTPATTPPSFTGKLNRTYMGRPVFGCDQGFVSPNTTGAVACATTGNSPSMEVVYEADLSNTIRTSSTPALPSDCLGVGLSSVPAIVHNRYYLFTGTSGRSELHCASRQGSSGQPLVDNVEAMKFWYGEAGVAAIPGAAPTASQALDSRRVMRYVTAANLAQPNFSRVIAVKVCLLVRSSEAVLDMELYPDPLNPPKYLDCDSTEQTITDRFIRRAYFTTVTLRNKMDF